YQASTHLLTLAFLLVLMGEQPNRYGRRARSCPPLPSTPRPAYWMPPALCSRILTFDFLHDACGEVACDRNILQADQRIVQSQFVFPVLLRLRMTRQPGTQLGFLGRGEFPPPGLLAQLLVKWIVSHTSLFGLKPLPIESCIHFGPLHWPERK